MDEEIDSIIVSGGTGKRMEELARNYGCKSLIPILGIPIFGYLVDSIREVLPSSRLIFAIDDPDLRNGFEENLKKFCVENYVIYEGLSRGPVQAFYEAGSMCRTERVLVFFGNQLVPPSHLKKLLSYDRDKMVVSGFGLLSEDNCKIATIDGQFRVIDVQRYDHLESLKENEIYLDVPYAVPNNFFSMETFPEIKRLFVKTPMERANLRERGQVVVVKSDFPPEFHYKSEFRGLEREIRHHWPHVVSRLGENFDD